MAAKRKPWKNGKRGGINAKWYFRPRTASFAVTRRWGDERTKERRRRCKFANEWILLLLLLDARIYGSDKVTQERVIVDFNTGFLRPLSQKKDVINGDHR